MKVYTDWYQVIKKNYYQVFFVFTAFLVMVLVSYFFVSSILRNRLLTNADVNLFNAEANIRAALAEAEITLNTSLHNIIGMIQANAAQEEILEYLKSTTGWIRQNHRGMMGFYGIYGYIRGEFMDSLDFNPEKEYLPQTRPWYQAAVRSGNTPVAYTPPYFDARTGTMIISATKRIVDEMGKSYGILAIDMNMERSNEYIKTLRLGSGGYGMIVSKNMTVMIHPGKDAIGKQLQELGGDFGDISRRLRTGYGISARRYRDASGRQVITFFRRMFNGWYVGLITPAMTYYRDLHYAALILSIVGFFLTCALSYLLLRISAAKMKADEDSRSKSTFLAKMSHEIRTPMNAIIGMNELVLREALSPKVRNYADNIRQAGNKLLSIINDILDFSKIESGRMDIINVPYRIASIIDDVIAIITMRLNEKPISFITRIESSLPGVLIGDEVRVRQVLLNLLINAVKYTGTGHIALSIRRKDRPEKQEETEPPEKKKRIFLAFEVADTGIGIKKEDMEKLFVGFTQFDKNKNQNIEGTGLGLAISRNLCILMGGEITVKSKYGQGSVFTALIPQLVEDDTPFARVEDPETKSVLIYEKRPLYGESAAYTINNLGVNCAVVQNRDDFVEQFARRAWQFIFTSPALLDEVRQIISDRNQPPGAGREAPLPEDPVLILLAESGQAPQSGIPTIFLPLQPLTAARMLNGQKSGKGGRCQDGCYIEIPGVRFTAPGSRVLIVDDIETNLKVAEGILIPYKMSIDCASGGFEAVQLVQKNRYDFVLMDHMMPGMDGIEAVHAIRAWEASQRKEGVCIKETPVIALTANAMSGMREMFIEKGFNDYIPKPIELTELDAIIARWIPPEKRIENSPKRDGTPGNTELVIPGLDTPKGINMTGGTEAGYRKVLAQFYKDAGERRAVFTEVPAEGDLSAFVIHAHALKSAAGVIGAGALSAEAAALESAGKAGDTAALAEKLPGFYEHLSRIIDGIGKALDEKEGARSGGNGAGSPAGTLLSFLKAALDTKNMKEIDRTLAELEKLPLDAKDRNAVNEVSDKVLMGDYQEAVETVNSVLAPGGGGFTGR